MEEQTEKTTGDQAEPGQLPEMAERHEEATRPEPPEGWREMKVAELAELCKARGLAMGGKRADLVKRLELHYYGSSQEHVNGRVVCPYCKSAAKCNGTRWMSETTVRRSYRCVGRRRHSFTLDSKATKP